MIGMASRQLRATGFEINKNKMSVIFLVKHFGACIY